MDFLLQFGPSHYNDLFRCDHPYFGRDGKGDISEFVATYKKNYALTNGKGLICIPSGNHDSQRMRKYLDPEEMKLAFAFLFSMPGAPFLYYGDEIGMRQLDIPSVEGGYERTGARTPDAVGTLRPRTAAFHPRRPEWLYTPLDPAADAPTVESQQDDPDSLLNESAQTHRGAPCQPRARRGRFDFLCLVRKRRRAAALPAGSRRPAGACRAEPVPQKPASCPCAFTARQVLYAHGQAAALADGVLQMAGESATFIEV